MGRFGMWRAVLGALAAVLVGCAVAQPVVYYHEGSTRKIEQLTGDWDRALGVRTASQTDVRAGFWATDLGSTFEHEGNLFFLFGDTWGGREGLLDTFGVSSAGSPWNLFMDVPVAEDGKWRAIAPEGLEHGEFAVPSHGISVNGSIYVVFTQPDGEGNHMRRSFMIVSHDDGASWEVLYELDNGDPAEPVFVNVWLERRDGFIYMFGSGSYRASSPTVARVREELFPQRWAWEYFAGMSEVGAESWSGEARESVGLFEHEQVGEFSCVWVEQLSCWVMLYNSLVPRGIVMRTAADVVGPWSDGVVIMDPGMCGAYGDFMHVSWGVERRDMLFDPGRQMEFGGEYGPYLISRFTSGTAERCELFYTMSTWNPYQVVMMKSVVGLERGNVLPMAGAQVLGHDGWVRFPAGVAEEFVRDGVACISTFSGEGDAGRGWLWQRLPAGTQSVGFQIHGGKGEVFLLEDFSGLPVDGKVEEVSERLRAGEFGRVVRRATGMNDNSDVITWRWPTTAFDMDSLGGVVLDAYDDGWGFVSVSELTVQVPLEVMERPHPEI